MIPVPKSLPTEGLKKSVEGEHRIYKHILLQCAACKLHAILKIEA